MLPIGSSVKSSNVLRTCRVPPGFGRPVGGRGPLLSVVQATSSAKQKATSVTAALAGEHRFIDMAPKGGREGPACSGGRPVGGTGIGLFLHGAEAFLNGHQGRGLDGLNRTPRRRSNRERGRCVIAGELTDAHDVVFAEAVEEAVHATADSFSQTIDADPRSGWALICAPHDSGVYAAWTR